MKQCCNIKPLALFSSLALLLASIKAIEAFHLTTNVPSMISAVQSYTYCSFAQIVQGLPYPQYIKFTQTNSQMVFQFRNLSNQTQSVIPPAPKLTVTIGKNFTSDCQAALSEINYFGCSPKWPDYTIIIVCGNYTHQIMSTLKVFASGNTKIYDGDIIAKPESELTYYKDQSLDIANIYDGTYSTTSLISKFFFRRPTTPLNISAPAYYKQYFPMQSKPTVVPIQAILQKAVGANNLNIIDRIFGIGEGRKYDAYVTNRSELIIVNSSSNEVRYIWKPQQQQKILKITKLCWSYTIAVLVEGYGAFAYLLQFQSTLNGTVSLVAARKSSSLLDGGQSATKCEFFSVGKYVICQIYRYDAFNKIKLFRKQNNNKSKDIIIRTDWYILWAEGININMKKQQFNRVVDIKTSQDLCSTNQYYQGNSKWQISSQNMPQQYKQDGKTVPKISYERFQIQLNIEGKIISFNQRQSDGSYIGKELFIIYKPQQQSIGFLSCLLGKCSNLLTLPYKMSTNPQVIMLESSMNSKNVTHQIHTFVACVDPSNGFKPAAVYTISQIYQNFTSTTAKVAILPLQVSNYALLTTQFNYIANNHSSIYLGKTSIQSKFYSQISPLSNFNEGNSVRYAYEFEVDGFKQCVIRCKGQCWGWQQNFKIIFYRLDNQQSKQKQNGVVVKQVGYRFNKTYVIEDVRYFPQYANKSYNAQCAESGLLVYSIINNHIVLYSSDLTVSYEINEKFENIKIGNSLLLTQYLNQITVRKIQQNSNQKQMQIIERIRGLKMENIVMDLRSPGFFDTARNIYNSYIQKV